MSLSQFVHVRLLRVAYFNIKESTPIIYAHWYCDIMPKITAYSSKSKLGHSRVVDILRHSGSDPPNIATDRHYWQLIRPMQRLHNLLTELQFTYFSLALWYCIAIAVVITHQR